MALEAKTVTAGKITSEQAQALYVLKHAKGIEQRREALRATGLDGVDPRPLISAGVVSVTADGQLRLRPEGRLAAADRLPPERQEAFNAVIGASFAGETSAPSVDKRSSEIAQRELARRAAMAAEATRNDWVASVIRKSKPTIGDSYGALKKKLNALESISLRQRAALDRGVQEDFYDMYERVRVLMQLRKKLEAAKTADKRAELKAQINAVFELVKNPSDEDIRRQREARIRAARERELPRQRSERLGKERVERERLRAKEIRKEDLRRLPAHDAALTKANELIARFERQQRAHAEGERSAPAKAQLIKGNRGALGVLSAERDRLLRSPEERDVNDKLEAVDALSQYAMSVMGIAPTPGESLVPQDEGVLSSLRERASQPESQKFVSRPMTHRTFGKYVLVNGQPKYEVSTKDLLEAKAELEEALKTKDSDIQAEKFAGMQTGKKSVRGKKLAGTVYGNDPFYSLRDNDEYRRLWREMRALREEKRRQKGASLTTAREERLKSVEAQLDRLRRDAIGDRKKIDSRAVRERAKAMHDDIVRELDDRKKVLFEKHHKDVLDQRDARIRVSREYLADLAARMERVQPGLGVKLAQRFDRLTDSFLLALDAAGQPDVKSKQKSLETILATVLRDKASAADGLAAAESARSEQLSRIESQPIPESIKAQRRELLDKEVAEHRASVAALAQREAELKRKLSNLSIDKMAQLTKRERMVAGLPDSGAQTGLTDVGGQIRDALAYGGDPVMVVDQLLRQQATPDYLREIDKFATAKIRKSKAFSKSSQQEISVREAIEGQRDRESAQANERRQMLEKLEAQRAKLSRQLESATSQDIRQRLQNALDQMGEQINKLRTGEVRASGLLMDVLQETTKERSILLQARENEFKKVQRLLRDLLAGKPIAYQYMERGEVVKASGIQRVPQAELEKAKLRAASKAGISTEINTLISNGDAHGIDSAIAVLESEAQFVKEFESKYQREALKIVERFTDLQSKVDASDDTAEEYAKVKAEYDEAIGNQKELEKQMKKAQSSGIPMSERKEILVSIKERRKELSDQLAKLSPPLQKAASVLVKQPVKYKNNEAANLLSASEYEEYKYLKPKYEKIVANAQDSDVGMVFLQPGQAPLEIAVAEERTKRYATARQAAGKSMLVGEYPLVDESAIKEYREYYGKSPESTRQKVYEDHLQRLVRDQAALAGYLRAYKNKVEVDNVQYALKLFKPQRVTKAIFVSKGYDNRDFDTLVELSKEQACERAKNLTEIFSSQVMFNRAVRNAVRGYVLGLSEASGSKTFDRDLKLASKLLYADVEPNEDMLEAQSRMMSRFNPADKNGFSLPLGTEISMIDSRLAVVLGRIKQAMVAMAAKGMNLDFSEVLKSEGQLSDYESSIRKAKVKPEDRASALAILSMVDASFEEAKARGSEIIASKTLDSGGGEDGSERVAVSTFLEKDRAYQNVKEYTERVETKGVNILTPEEAATFISAELFQDKQIKAIARKIDAERRERIEKRQAYEARMKALGLEAGERLHALPAKFGDKKKRVFSPGGLHSIVPVLNGEADFKARYKNKGVKKKKIAVSNNSGQNAIREMIAMAGQIYRSSPTPPENFEFAVDTTGDKVSLVAVYMPTQAAEDFLYKETAEGFLPSGVIGRLESKMRAYEHAVKNNTPFSWWDRYAEAYINKTLPASPRAPVIRRIRRKDSVEAKADAALNKRANREAIESISRAADQVPLMSEAEFDRDFPPQQFERLLVPSSAREIRGRMDPSRTVGFRYTPITKDGIVQRLVAPLNVSPDRGKRSLFARYYAVQLRTMFTEKVLSSPEKMKALMFPQLDEKSSVGATVRPLRQADIMWPRLAQFVVVNGRDKTVSLYIVFPKKIGVTDQPDVSTIIRMVQSSEAITDYELTRARVAARWVADPSNQPNKWIRAIEAAIVRRPVKNPGKAPRTIRPDDYIYVEFEPLLGKGVRQGVVKEMRPFGQVERLSGHAGLRKMIRKGLEYDFFAIPKSEISMKYMRYNKPYDLFFDGEQIFINTPDEKVSSYVRLSPAGVPQPKSVTGVPRSTRLTDRVRHVMQSLRMNPSSLEEYVRERQAEVKDRLSPPEIEDLENRLARYKQNQDGRTLRALVERAQKARKSSDRRVSKAANDVLRDLRKHKG